MKVLHVEKTTRGKRYEGRPWVGKEMDKIDSLIDEAREEPSNNKAKKKKSKGGIYISNNVENKKREKKSLL